MIFACRITNKVLVWWCVCQRNDGIIQWCWQRHLYISIINKWFYCNDKAKMCVCVRSYKQYFGIWSAQNCTCHVFSHFLTVPKFHSNTIVIHVKNHNLCLHPSSNPIEFNTMFPKIGFWFVSFCSRPVFMSTGTTLLLVIFDCHFFFSRVNLCVFYAYLLAMYWQQQQQQWHQQCQQNGFV